MPNDEDLEQLRDLLFSEDESNFELAMQIIKGLNVDRWTVYGDLRRSAEFFNTMWRTSRNIVLFLRELRQRQLELSRRNINYLPDYLAILAPAVKIASLQYNSFTHIPTPLLAYQQLQQLNISNNKIGEIAEEFWQLSSLQHLDLSDNLFNTLSPNIAKAQQLDFLDVKSPNYVKLPLQIAEISQLRTLYWGATADDATINKIDLAAQIENISNCRSLTELRIYSGDVKIFPKLLCKMQNLQHLSMYFCHFHDIPDSIAELKNLETLNLHYRTDSKIPFAISQLPKLRELTITSPYLKIFPEFLKQMPQLKLLVLPYACFWGQNLEIIKQNMPNTKISFTHTVF